jgi:hypothetical protein
MVSAQYGHFFVLLFNAFIIILIVRIIIASAMTGKIQIRIICIGCIPNGSMGFLLSKHHAN